MEIFPKLFRASILTNRDDQRSTSSFVVGRIIKLIWRDVKCSNYTSQSQRMTFVKRFHNNHFLTGDEMKMYQSERSRTMKMFMEVKRIKSCRFIIIESATIFDCLWCWCCSYDNTKRFIFFFVFIHTRSLITWKNISEIFLKKISHISLSNLIPMKNLPRVLISVWAKNSRNTKFPTESMGGSVE